MIYAVTEWSNQNEHNFFLFDGNKIDPSKPFEAAYLQLLERAAASSSKDVQTGNAWNTLKGLFESGQHIALRDFDGYDHLVGGKTLTQVLNDPVQKMGHAFVLAMLLLNDPALQQCDMR